MSIAILMMADDRRDYTEASLRSLREKLPGQPYKLFVHDDSCDPMFSFFLGSLLDEVWRGDWEVMCATTKRGFGGAIEYAWQYIYDQLEYDYVFHTENDFTYNSVIPIQSMVNILEHDPALGQVALLRQPWNDKEKAAGGIIPSYPEGTFVERQVAFAPYLEQSAFWTTNPSLVPAWVIGLGWKNVPESEGMFTFKLRDMGIKFSFYGRLDDPPLVEHIGVHRVAEVGY